MTLSCFKQLPWNFTLIFLEQINSGASVLSGGDFYSEVPSSSKRNLPLK